MVEDIHYYTWRSRRRWPEDNLITIFTEGDWDTSFYRRMTGPSLGRYVHYECRRGPNGQTGAYNAWSLMRENRRLNGGGSLGPHLNRFYCLLDGEEAAHAAVPDLQKTAQFLVNDVDWFEPLADAEPYRTFTEPSGALFLGCHEPENLYLLHAGLLETMFRQWGYQRKLFGRELVVRDSWQILQRSLIISEFTCFAKTYNIEHKAFHDALNELRTRHGKLKDHIGSILHALEFPDQGKKPQERIVPNSILLLGVEAVRDRVMNIEKGNSDISNFDPRLLTICDGKAFLELALPGNNNWREHFDSTLVANGFTTLFQLGLTEALQRLAARRMTSRIRPSPEDEWTVGSGATSWTARRRSRRNLPPMLLPEEPRRRIGN
jgi:hypothetical protein